MSERERGRVNGSTVDACIGKGFWGWVNGSFGFHVWGKEGNGDGLPTAALFRAQSMVPNGIGQMGSCEKGNIRGEMLSLEPPNAHAMGWYDGDEVCGTLLWEFSTARTTMTLRNRLEVCGPISNCKTHIHCLVQFHNRGWHANFAIVQTEDYLSLSLLRLVQQCLWFEYIIIYFIDTVLVVVYLGSL